MGSLCTKRPNIIENKKKQSKNMTSFSKHSDFKKKYEYICMLGNGAFGKVRLYRDIFCKEMKYAIKTIKKEGISKYQRDSILEEVNILRELDHPNIVKYYDTYEDDFYIHLVMEYLPGEDLYKVITNKKYNNYSEYDAAEIITNLLKALSFIHNKKIVHRDIKPENILFSIGGDYKTLKLIDFGLSTHTITTNGKAVGSPYYMSPEIINGNYTFKTDIWSVGVILYVLITGNFPFNAPNQEECFYLIQNQDYDKNILEISYCSKEVKDLIEKLLVKDEKNRLGIDEALEHAWLKRFGGKSEDKNNLKHSSNHVISNDIISHIKKFTSRNSFYKEVLFYMAKISNDDEVFKLKETFMKLDKDNTGTLTFDEILTAFEEIGVKVDKNEINEIWNGLDFHKDGEVNYTEFLAATISSINFHKEEKIWSAFKYFESNSESGYITSDSVIDALKTNNLSINENQLKNYFDEMKNGNKKLNFEEFKKMVFK